MAWSYCPLLLMLMFFNDCPFKVGVTTSVTVPWALILTVSHAFWSATR